MDKTNRKGLYLAGEDLRKFIYTSNDKYYIELTAWDNREGYTVSMDTDLGVKVFELSVQELNAIKFMADSLDYDV